MDLLKKTKKTKKRRWSQKYKKSINCKRPKGFSRSNIVNMVVKNKNKNKI